MKTRYLLLAFSFYLLALAAAACGGSEEQKKLPDEKAPQEKALLSDKESAELLVANCYACHSPEGQASGPSMLDIRERYLAAHPGKEDFEAALLAFVEQPSEQKVLMPEAVKRFGLMPKMSYPEKNLRSIAAFLYTQSPEQLKGLQANKGASAELPEDPLERGLHYAMGVKSLLGKNLLNAVNTLGTEEAVAFCNHRAYPLTDSMARTFGANIKRVSDQARNPQNAANEEEMQIIKTFKASLSRQEKITPYCKTRASGSWPTIPSKPAKCVCNATAAKTRTSNLLCGAKSAASIPKTEPLATAKIN